jgi:hypothetical protein
MDISLPVKIFSDKQFIRALEKSCFLILGAAQDLVSMRFFGHFAPGEWQKRQLLQRSLIACI